ncbi:hypothetical protein L210DRAFT_408442 [Boletus edulis BED1]|uniref:C2H2-type domain-containing protein n=1 Tax=Boletus edulis BED1 TaxID=1328754 RepID=A0AAD4BC58_BOLED|nr:hypothetical protein L210DRAFT_408442 [Boletus edulis BED1]
MVGMGSYFSQAVLDETFASGNIPQIILHTQPVPDSISGTFSPMEYHQASFATNLNHPSFHASDVVMSCSSPGSTENVINNDRRFPVVIYRPPEKKGLGHRPSKRACAINVEGLWVDKADLYHCAGHGNSTISVHECLWATSGGPCGMWIIGSRPRVGAHIRKWHPVQNHTKSTAECLWYGCAKTMLKDSINRHVVTSHFKEAFHCQGCDEEFSRQDVYNQHVEDSEMCKGTGAAIVYGTERRVIDAHQALHQGGAIRYAGR